MRVFQGKWAEARQSEREDVGVGGRYSCLHLDVGHGDTGHGFCRQLRVRTKGKALSKSGAQTLAIKR